MDYIKGTRHCQAQKCKSLQASGVEIDFILNKKYPYEVKIIPDKQDIKKLDVLTKELKLKDYKIVSKKYSRLENVIYGFML